MSSNIKGGDSLANFFKSLSKEMQQNILPSAMVAGGEILAAEIRARAPVGPPSSENARERGGYQGALRDSVRVISRIGKNGVVTVIVRVGGVNRKGADVFYPHMVEYGVLAHLIKPKKKRALAFGGKVAPVIHHPGAAPQPFIRPALDAKANEVSETIGVKVNERLIYRRIGA